MYDVKVIGVTDNYDSTKENNDLFTFESIFAEMYAADISKKITAYKKLKQGIKWWQTENTSDLWI